MRVERIRQDNLRRERPFHLLAHDVHQAPRWAEDPPGSADEGQLQASLAVVAPARRPARMIQEGEARAVQVCYHRERMPEGVPKVAALGELDHAEALAAVQGFE